MCSNTEVVNCLECQMDDLVETFEEFVKKSLILLSLGFGAIVCTLLYVLKIVSERSEVLAANNRNPNTTPITANPSLATNIAQHSQVTSSCEQSMRDMSSNTDVRNFTKSNSIIPSQRVDGYNTSTPRKCNPLLKSCSNIDQSSIRNSGVCPNLKISNPCKPGCPKSSLTKTGIPTSPNSTSIPNQSVPRTSPNYHSGRSSCCSMCNDDDEIR